MLNGDRDFGCRLPVFENLKRFDFCGRPDGFNWVLGLVHNLSECPVLEELYFKVSNFVLFIGLVLKQKTYVFPY